MGEKPEERKFDTLSLLAGLSGKDTSDYSLDEILNEFGGRTEPTQPPQPPQQSPQQPTEEPENIIDQIQQAIDREMELNMAAPEPVFRLEKEAPAEEEKPPLPEDKPDYGDPELNQIFQEQKIRLERKAEEKQLPSRQRERQKPAAPEEAPEEEDIPEEKPRKSRSKARLKVLEQPEPVPDAAETFKKYARAIRPARTRMTGVLILTLAAVIWTAVNQFGWLTSPAFASNQIASKILLGLMLLCALLSMNVVKEGIGSIFDLKFTLNSLIVLAFLVAAVDAVLCKDETPIPFCAVVCLEFLFAAWGDTLKKVGIRRSLKVLQKLEGEPGAAVCVDGAWDGGSLVVSGEGSQEEHVRGVLASNLTEQRMRIYAPIAAILSLGLAFFVKVKTGNSLTWAWSSMMIGALPAAGFISYYRPFAILSARLLKQGAAIGGWLGAKRLGSGKGALLRDEDVFPPDHVTLNGMKVYGSYSVGQTVGYAAAVIEASGSGLAPLFRELRESNNGRNFMVSQFRRYEGGGYGAEIGGDVVLLGSLRFMQLMGVYMHEGTKVRNAVYLSVGGEMCGVFAINYAPAGKVRKGLRQIVDCSGVMPVFGTRDFLITPMMVEERYKVQNSSLEFPSAEERDRLCRLPNGGQAEQGAVLTKPGFGAFADAVVGAKILRLVTNVSTAINLVGGILGLALMFFLTYLGAQSAVTAMNMLLFAVIWALPSLILTSWAGRY